MRSFKREGDWIFEFESAKEYWKYVLGGILGNILGVVVLGLMLWIITLIWG